MKFGSLTILWANGRYRKCRCDCGVEKLVRIDHLKSGAIVSCGCVGKANSAAAKKTHGMSQTKVFKVWLGILDRCKNDRSGNYGKRGIRVCARWRNSFESFLSDVGPMPTPGHSIERKKVNGNYEPDNCIWATRKEQARNTRRNTRLTLDGTSATIAEWSEITGLKASTICVRLYTLGWSVRDALASPVGKL